MRAPDLRVLRLAFLALPLAGCTAGEVELYEPEGSGLERGLTVKVELEAVGAELGEVLGWTGGVPEAEVRVHRLGTELRWQTAFTDSSGLARFVDLLPGRYRVAGYRMLTDEEVEQVGGRRRAFGDGRIIALTGPRTMPLTLMADQRGSLLISELYGTHPYVFETKYGFHPYIEIYNNSDTTIYLDGKILGWCYHVDVECNGECALTERFLNDPDGVWARFFHRFPGSGTDHPLAAGAIAVVAMDAVDHSQFHPSFPDLSHADFELLGHADVDNPAVPNVPDVGLAPWFTGHGMRVSVKKTYFLSEPVDVEVLPRAFDDLTLDEWVRFPGWALLDVLATEDIDPERERECPPCAQKVHRNFDRLAGGFIEHGEDLEFSVQRIVLEYTADGRAILQDTNTSAIDLIRAPYTVGTLSQSN